MNFGVPDSMKSVDFPVAVVDNVEDILGDIEVISECIVVLVGEANALSGLSSTRFWESFSGIFFCFFRTLPESESRGSEYRLRRLIYSFRLTSNFSFSLRFSSVIGCCSLSNLFSRFLRRILNRLLMVRLCTIFV